VKNIAEYGERRVQDMKDELKGEKKRFGNDAEARQELAEFFESVGLVMKGSATETHT
jgi:hypothetical protein